MSFSTLSSISSHFSGSASDQHRYDIGSLAKSNPHSAIHSKSDSRNRELWWSVNFSRRLKPLQRGSFDALGMCVSSLRRHIA